MALGAFVTENALLRQRRWPLSIQHDPFARSMDKPLVVVVYDVSTGSLMFYKSQKSIPMGSKPHMHYLHPHRSEDQDNLN